MEEWKDIEGFEGLYQISSYGRVASKFFNKTKIRKTCISQRGYSRINLVKDRKMYCFFTHRLVAKAFIPNPENFETVDHIDFDQLNNTVENLRWLSHKENSVRRRPPKERVSKISYLCHQILGIIDSSGSIEDIRKIVIGKMKALR